MLVEDVMTEGVVTIPSDVDLGEAAGSMTEKNIGCLVVISEDRTAPAGMLTETDVLRRAVSTDKPPSEVPTKGSFTSPLITVGPKRTVRHAVNKMLDQGVKRLPVIDDDALDLIGMVTITDVALRYDEIRSDAAEMVQKPETFRGK